MPGTVANASTIPFVPRVSISTNPVRNVPRMLPTIPQAYTWPIAAPVRFWARSRSIASFATTGLIVPSAIAGSRNTSITTQSTRNPQSYPFIRIARLRMGVLSPRIISPSLPWTQFS